MKRLTAFVFLSSMALSSCTSNLKYPQTEKIPVVDNYFGTEVEDPYRWLEDDNSPETKAWVEAQNKVSRKYLDKLPGRKAIGKRLEALLRYEKIELPLKVDGKYCYAYNDGFSNQSIHLIRESLSAEPQVLLDPNTLSEDGTVAVQKLSFSDNGKYLAYIITRNGSDWNEIFVLDRESGLTLEDHILWTKFSDASWYGDGFFYSGYSEPDKQNELTSSNECQKVFYHKIGTPQSEDILVFEDPSNPQLFYEVSVDEKEGYLILVTTPGYATSIKVRPLADPKAKFRTIMPLDGAVNNPIAIIDKSLYIRTNLNAPNGKVVVCDLSKPGAALKDLIPESDCKINSVSPAGEGFLLTCEKDACSRLFLVDRNGADKQEITLPGLGMAEAWSAKGENELFYSFSDFLTPGETYLYDISKKESTLFFKSQVPLDPEDFVTKEVFFESKDGTPIPMFIIHRKDVVPDGKRPTLMYGYGGFDISLNPAYSITRVPYALLDAGGVYASVNLRGGGEYGELWHRAGTLLEKQNVFDDFIAAAEYLIANNYTSPGKIACLGGSNGGLLVGAVVNQRPDLFGVGIPQVGVMDMLRYQYFTVGWNWADDYGRSDDSKEMFEYLLGYSPLHTIRNDGTPYPAILVTSADHDDRVVPAHSFKYTARLQASNTGDAPKILRVEANAGHGHSKPISKKIDEYTDVYAFILYNLGVKYK